MNYYIWCLSPACSIFSKSLGLTLDTWNLAHLKLRSISWKFSILSHIQNSKRLLVLNILKTYSFPNLTFIIIIIIVIEIDTELHDKVYVWMTSEFCLVFSRGFPILRIMSKTEGRSKVYLAGKIRALSACIIALAISVLNRIAPCLGANVARWFAYPFLWTNRDISLGSNLASFKSNLLAL